MSFQLTDLGSLEASSQVKAVARAQGVPGEEQMDSYPKTELPDATQQWDVRA